MRGAGSTRLMRADLHVHSLHSGFTSTLRLFRSRDCYNSPDAVYRAARARGMDLVTITDHNSIEGCLELLDRNPDARDIIMGEEIDCMVPGTGVRVHLGALGLTEADHRDVQPLRGNVFEAAALLRSRGVALVLHHPFHFVGKGADVARYLEQVLPIVHAVEVRNATMDSSHNHLASAIATGQNGTRVGQTGGSDAHVQRHIAGAFTEAPGRSREAFLESVKRGECRAAGAHGTRGRLAYEIYGVVFNYWGALLGLHPSGLTPIERAGGIGCSLLSLPFQFIPFVVTLMQKRDERRRVARCRRELRASHGERIDEG
jgi:predicted metal-dependent phosphoesterase TrpH